MVEILDLSKDLYNFELCKYSGISEIFNFISFIFLHIFFILFYNMVEILDLSKDLYNFELCKYSGISEIFNFISFIFLHIFLFYFIIWQKY